MTIKDRIEQDVRVWCQLGVPALLQRFLLATGRTFHPQALPSRYRRMQMKKCFENAMRLVKRSNGKLRYAEGYATSKLGLLIHHAWAVDADDRVIDPTWRDPADCEYFGRIFTIEEWERETDYTQCMCALDSNTGMNWRFMFAQVPGLQEQVEAAQKKAPVLRESAGASKDHADQA